MARMGRDGFNPTKTNKIASELGKRPTSEGHNLTVTVMWVWSGQPFEIYQLKFSHEGDTR